MRVLEYNVAVIPDPPEEKTKGGLHLPQMVMEVNEHAATRGTLAALSPMAFSFEDWPEGEPKPQVGDRVVFSKHAGMVLEDDGVKYRVMKDKDIVAVLA